MATNRGRGGAANRQRKDKRYCCHGTCKSSTRDSDPEVKMIPFPKPCSLYIQTIYDKSVIHDVKKCTQCLKARRWLHLCKRTDKRLQQLSDINTKTYICSKHFAYPSGPTELHPDPFPADKDEVAVNKLRSKLRKPPATRHATTKPKKRKGQKSSPATLTSPDIVDVEDCSIISESDPLELNDRNETISKPVCDKKHIRAPDNSIANQPATSDPVPEGFLSNLAVCLVLLGWFVCFEKEKVRVKIGKVHVLITRNYQIEFEVNGKNVPGNENVWRAFPRRFDPNQDDCVESLVEIFETVKQQWRVCKEYTMAEATREYDQPQTNPADDPGSLPSTRCQILAKKEICDSCKFTNAKKSKNSSILKLNTNIQYIGSEALDYIENARKKFRLEKQKASQLEV